MMFKNNKVWVEVDRDNNPVIRNGKVKIKYQLDQKYEYQVRKDGIKPLGSLEGKTKAGQAEKPGTKVARKGRSDTQNENIPKNAVLVFTDGASSGNPGPAGIGVVLKYRENEKKISKYIGETTNNVAELEAIRVGLSEIKNHALPVRVFTDSSYAFGVLTLGWKAKKNQDLILKIKKLMNTFQDLRIIKVKGHSGLAGNEAADTLATGAIKKAVG
ncbi:MAG: hypothetical protein B5M56_10905 [Desulfococcus sp. 4484_241]|nr:MAG: hypothetical protein B5M56_10905 [Desulfococcus sp. 4484_241]